MFVKIREQTYWVTFFVIVTLNVTGVENRLHFTLTGIKCTCLDPRFVTITLCELKAVKRNYKECSIRAILNEKRVDNISIYIAIKRRGYEHLKPSLELNVDACAFLRNKRRNPIVNLLYQLSSLEKYSNFNDSCPIYNEIIVDKARVDENFISWIPIPTGDYTVFSTWIAYNVSRVQVDIRCKFFDA